MPKTWKYDFDIAKYTKAIELNPDDCRAYNNRGIAYLKKGDVDLSIADFNKAIELNPAYDIGYVNRGIAYQEIGEYDLSINDCTKAIELNNKNGMAYNNRGFCCLLLGRLEDAERDIKVALAITPDNIYALNSMAELYAAKNNPEEACRWLKKTIEKGFNNWGYIKTSRTYDNIRNSPCFIEIISRYGSSQSPSATVPEHSP